MGAGDGKWNDSDKIEEMRWNLSKINPFVVRFFTSNASVVFSYLQKTFTKALILHYFHSECHIQIETDASGFAISGVFHQLTSEYVTYTNPDLFTSKIHQ